MIQHWHAWLQLGAKMSRKRNRTNKKDNWFSANYWQSANFNERAFAKNLDMLVAIAMSRFKWEGLPETCDERFLQLQLLRTGYATIAHHPDYPDIWQTLMAAPQGEFDAYGLPTRWRAVGYNGTTFDVNSDNGVLVYYSSSRINPWNALEMFARKLAHYERTEDINLTHQQKPWVLLAPPEQYTELMNLYKQIAGGEPAILSNKGLAGILDEIKAIDTKVPLEVEGLARGYQNVMNNALLFLGVPHLAFEKGERMIEREAMANTAPTEMMLLDCLNAQRKASEEFNRLSGLETSVHYSMDLQSLNFNYMNNIEAQAQDGLLGGGL